MLRLGFGLEVGIGDEDPGLVLPRFDRRELYLPAAWTSDPDRCAEAGIPDDVKFHTKYQLAQQMIERARAAGTPFAWVTADEVYGQAAPRRDYLERERISYVMAVRRTETVAMTTGSSNAETVIGAPTLNGRGSAPVTEQKARACPTGR